MKRSCKPGTPTNWIRFAHWSTRCGKGSFLRGADGRAFAYWQRALELDPGIRSASSQWREAMCSG